MRAWQGRVRMLYALSVLQRRLCYVHGFISTTLPRLCNYHSTSMPRLRRSHYALNRFCWFMHARSRLLLRLCHVQEFDINTRFNFSDIRFCFNYGTVNMTSEQSLTYYCHFVFFNVTNSNHAPTTLIEFGRILQDVVRTSWSSPDWRAWIIFSIHIIIEKK